MKIANLHPLLRNGLNGLAIVGSVGLCLLLLSTRFSGMEILGVGPSWLVMWTIAWSLRRSIWHAATAGVVLGLIQDAMTLPSLAALGTMPSHILSLTTVGVLTFVLYKRRYLTDEILPVAMATFGLTLVSEIVTGGQYFVQTALARSLDASFDSFGYLWSNQSPAMLITALLSSLWMPLLYYPLHWWWQKIFAATKLV